MHQTLRPSHWPRPRGYVHGVAATGRTVAVAGQVGWTAGGVFEARDMAGQMRQALENVVAVLKEGGAGPEHLVAMTVFIVDLPAYRAQEAEIGRAWREVIGWTYPAVTAVGVPALLVEGALVEVSALALVPQVEA